jgi:glycine/D-amino acid oxidase-like deaminating enzyme
VRDETDVLIIGGGLIGCACAYYLARDHVECLVVDRGELNREGSGSNAGSLHLQMRPPERRYSNDVLHEFVRMRSESARIWSQLDTELGCDLGLKIKGGFLVAETDQELEVGREMAIYQRKLGFDVETLGQRELRDLAPNLSTHLKGATYAPLEGSANTLLVAPAFAKLAGQLGARVRPYTEVMSIAPRLDGGFSVATSSGQIRARRVLNATGPWASRLTEMVGVRLSVFGRVIQVNVTERREPALTQLVGNMAGGLTLKQTTFGTFMVGGGWPASVDPTTGRFGVNQANMRGNLGLALRVLPMLSDVAVLRAWPGVIAHSLDCHGYRLQIFGELPGVPDYYVLTGGTLFTVGPLFARLAAELLRTGTTSLPVTAFHPSRFAVAVSV